jgi:hypothetical protein
MMRLTAALLNKLMDLRQVIDSLGLSQIALARDANISRFKLYEFLFGTRRLSTPEEQALKTVLLQHADRTEQAIKFLREKVGQA